MIWRGPLLQTLSGKDGACLLLARLCGRDACKSSLQCALWQSAQRNTMFSPGPGRFVSTAPLPARSRDELFQSFSSENSGTEHDNSRNHYTTLLEFLMHYWDESLTANRTNGLLTTYLAVLHARMRRQTGSCPAVSLSLSLKFTRQKVYLSRHLYQLALLFP